MISPDFTEKELEKALPFAIEAAEGVANKLLNQFGKPQSLTVKSGENDFATEWDRWAEEKITKSLSKYSANIGILGEEYGHRGSTSEYWTVDSIDGTNSFVRGIPTCNTMISLVREGDVLLSVINNFVTGNLCTAIRGNGAFSGRDRISISTRDIKNARIMAYINPDTEKGQEIDRRLRDAGATVQRASSVGDIFAQIARGAIEGYINFNPEKPSSAEWDYAPGSLLVQEAGGIIRTMGMDDFELGRPHFVASNQKVYRELDDIARK